MSKKNKIKKIDKVKSYSSDSDEMTSMLKILGFVVLILGLFYLVFAIATGEISFGKKKTVYKEEIQNVEILAGNIFSRSDSEYYVLMYDFDANDSISYENLHSLFQSYYGTSKLYLVDLGNKFNSSYVVEDRSMVNVSSVDTLKVVNGTLIKIESGKAVSYHVGVEEIKKVLFN